MLRSNSVRRSCTRALMLTALAGLAVSGASAQFDRNKPMCTVRGQVTDTGSSQYTLEISDMQGQTPLISIPVGGSGDFTSDPIPAGDYHIRLLDNSGHSVYEDFISVADSDQFLTIHPRAVRVERPVSGTVSISQLQRKIPSKARKEFKKALEASQKGNTQAAIEHLKKAIEIEPAYMEAYNNLGVRYLAQNQFDMAADEFHKAAELDQNSAPVFANLGIALYSLHRLPEAEKAVCRALKLDGTDRHARFLLGLTLFAEGNRDTEAMENLRMVEQDFPKARVAIAQILARAGEPKQAVAELKNYLRTGRADDPQQVQTWIDGLESAQ